MAGRNCFVIPSQLKTTSVYGREKNTNNHTRYHSASIRSRCRASQVSSSYAVMFGKIYVMLLNQKDPFWSCEARRVSVQTIKFRSV